MTDIEQLPKQIKDDIEDQSLDILQKIQKYIVVIGGWAVRSYAAKSVEHARYTLDVDAVAAEENLKKVHYILSKENAMIPKKTDWGIKYFKSYHPSSNSSYKPTLLKDLQIRIEISPPRIYEIDTDH